MTIRIAIVGFGKIARDEHLPSIRSNPAFELVAVVSHSRPADIDCAFFSTVGEMLAAMADMTDAVAICTPPGPRFAIAGEVIAAGIPILLEKPPTATLGELDDLIQLAGAKQVAVHTAWHSQYAAGVKAAADALEGEDIASISMVWYEDVRKYHAGQQWIWDAGGFGVFDPGINGLSILTRILAEPLLVRDASMLFPANRQAPIAADLVFHGQDHKARMDWRGEQDEQWSIEIKTRSGMNICLKRGGSELDINGVPQILPPHDEYRSIYADFSEVVRTGTSKIDRAPLRIVADCFLIGERKIGGDFV
ncbi:MAG: Gfo/Idh/MocA family oxidoreductase [Sphingomonadaceae bacterium]|nr:Gfo/Idh/MocA family oxidoreductase [Sphingomonadaceae bacterium]